MPYFAHARALPSLLARIWLFVGAHTIAARMESRQRRVMVAALLGDHIGGPLRSLAMVCFAHRREAIPPMPPAILIMRFSPIPVLLTALVVGLIWADRDASARFNRCTETQSLAHCRLVFHGR